jgi:hypothetical protein
MLRMRRRHRRLAPASQKKPQQTPELSNYGIMVPVHLIARRISVAGARIRCIVTVIQGNHGGGQCQWHTRDAEGAAARLWRDSLPVQRAAPSGTALAWPCLLKDHVYIRRRGRLGGMRVRCEDVGKIRQIIRA